MHKCGHCLENLVNLWNFPEILTYVLLCVNVGVAYTYVMCMWCWQ